MAGGEGPATQSGSSARRDRVVVALLSLVAAALAFASSRNGIGVSPDSVSYLAAARNIANGRGITDFDGRPLLNWPPGLPLALGAFEYLGVSATTATRALNATSFAATVVLSYALLARHIRSRHIVLVGTVVVAFAPPLLRTAGMVWAEPSFTVFVLAFVLLLERALARSSLLLLAIAGVVVSLASLVRYFGLPMIAVGVICTIVMSPQASRLGRLGAAAWFAVWSIAGPLWWSLRNVVRGDSPAGAFPGRRSLGTATSDLLRGLGRLGTPDPVPDALALIVGAAFLGIIVAGVIVCLRGDVTARTMLPVTLTATGGVAFAFVSRFRTGTDASARILAPLVPVLVVLALWLFERWRPLVEERIGMPAVALASTAIVLACLAWSVALAYDHGRDGQEYAATRWRDSELVRATRSLPAEALVYSDDPLPVSYVGRVQPVETYNLPGVTPPPGRTVASTSDLTRRACRRPVYVAWFGTQMPRVRGDRRMYPDGTLIAVSCAKPD